MHRRTALFLLVALVGCGKSDPAPTTTAPTTTAPAATTEPRTDLTDATASTKPIALEERQGALIVPWGAAYLRVPFTARVPKGWVPTRLPGEPVLDGSAGVATFGAGGASPSEPEIVIMGAACADCTAEQAHAGQKELTSLGDAVVVKSEITGPGAALHVYEKDGVRTAISSRTISAAPPVVVQCIAVGPPSDTWDALLGACGALSVGEVRPLLDGELLAAEEAKLAGCPGKTTVAYSGNKNATSFDEVKTAGAVLPGPGQLSVRLANIAEAALDGDEVMKGTLRLDLDLVAAPGQEVTSGTYPGDGKEPPRVEAVMMGAPTPGDAPPAADDCASWVECTPSTGWRGPNQKVEIIARTRTRVCGRFHLEEAGHQASGEFDVPILPEPARPEPARPEPARPEPARPEPARPEPAASPE